MQPHEWRVPRTLPVLKILGAILLPLLTWLIGRGNPVDYTIAGAAATALALWGLRDLVVPVRLTADRSGLTVVTGFAGRRGLAWSQIEAVRLDSRERRGLRTEVLEIDTGDTLYQFGRGDLGAHPYEVVDVLTALSPSGSSPGPQ